MRLRHEESDLTVTPTDDGWRVDYRGRAVESTYLEDAVARAIGVDAKHAVSVVDTLVNDYLASARTEASP